MKIKSNVTKRLLLIVVSFSMFALTNTFGQNNTNVVSAIELVRMNILYLGIDNPVRIAASAYKSSELIVTIDNGTITGSNGEYMAKPLQTGVANITVSCRGKEIQKTQFRVKKVDPPSIYIGGLEGGAISQAFLLAQNVLVVKNEDFDFDVKYEVIQFKVSGVIGGMVYEHRSDSSIITEKQKQLIRNLDKGNKLYFEEIRCKGPGGDTLDLPSIIFKIR